MRISVMKLVCLPSLLSLATACAEDREGAETWSPHCDQVETPLSLGETSPLGFSADELLAGLGSTASADLVWTEGGATTLTVSVTPGSDAVFVDQEEAAPPDDVGAYAGIAVSCDDYLRVAASLGLSTEDALLDDTFEVDLVATAADAARFDVEADRADFAHPAIFDPYRAEEYDAEYVAIDGALQAAGRTSGTLSLVTEGTDGDTAWQTGAVVAEWGAVE